MVKLFRMMIDLVEVVVFHLAQSLTVAFGLTFFQAVGALALMSCVAIFYVQLTNIVTKRCLTSFTTNMALGITVARSFMAHGSLACLQTVFFVVLKRAHLLTGVIAFEVVAFGSGCIALMRYVAFLDNLNVSVRELIMPQVTGAINCSIIGVVFVTFALDWTAVELFAFLFADRVLKECFTPKGAVVLGNFVDTVCFVLTKVMSV